LYITPLVNVKTNKHLIMQTILTIIIIGIASLYVAYKLYKMLTSPPPKNDKCGGCTACDLKNDASSCTK